MTRAASLLGWVLGATLAMGGNLSAQDYPNRPVRIVDPYVPGGSTDRSLRPLVAKLSEILGQASSAVSNSYNPSPLTLAAVSAAQLLEPPVTVAKGALTLLLEPKTAPP